MLKLRFLGLIFITLVLSACSKEEEAKPVPKTGVALVAIGPINFGGVLVGEYRDAAVRVYNYGPEALDTAAVTTKLTAPFYVQSVSEPCASGSLPADKNCIIAVRFFPNVAGTFEQDFTLGNATIRTTGRGLVGGVMDISETYWDIGQTIAGTEKRKTFIITNLGDFTIPAPTISLVSGITVGFNTCGSFIATLKTCSIELVAKKTMAGVTSENILFNAGNGGIVAVTVDNTVIPSEASGTISFVSPPATIIADGASEYTVVTQPIRDQFGNIVADGTHVRLSSNNAEILSSSPQSTFNGQITFTFRSPTVKGFTTISLLSSEASGFLRTLATSGPPSGAIEVQTYSNVITANGQTQIVFKLLPLRDQFGNVVEDGTQVWYFIEGGGTIQAPFNFTVLGSAQMNLTAATVTGQATFKIRAGPIYDANNNIVDWRASGNFPVTYIPGLPAGTIPITSAQNAIYAIEDQSYEDLGIPIRTSVTVGPVRDANNNIVATNTPLTLSVTGGVNITNGGANPVTVNTDINGMINFIVAGNGNRGSINISLSGGAGAVGNYSIWAFTDSRFTPNNNLENVFTLYETFNSATSLPSLNKKWAEFGAADLTAFTNNDGSAFKIRKNNTSTIRTWLNSLDYLQIPCWFSRKNFLQVGPCMRDNFRNRASLAYAAINDNGADTLATGPSHRPLATVKNGSNQNILQGGFSVGLHDPGTRDGWENILGTPIHPGVGFLPSNNTYLVFGGLVYEDVLQDFCPRITIETDGAGANSICNLRSSCTWNTTTQLCNYKSDTSFIGNTTSYSSIYFDMDKENQSTASTYRYGGMDYDQIGDYPPPMAHMALASDGNSFLYGFGGYQAIPDGGAYNQLHIYNAASTRWSSVYADGDPNERSINAEPAPRYQNSIAYIKETNSIYIAGGLRKYSCDEFLTKGSCHQYSACSWDDYEAIDCATSRQSGQNCYPNMPQSETILGEFCRPVSGSVCDMINPSEFPYNAPGNTLAQTECLKRPSCQWDIITNTCSIKDNSPSGGEGWTDGKDMWQLDLTPLEDNDNNTNPTWKKLCDSQEPYLGGNPNVPNPAFRSCNFPAGTAGVPVVYPDFSKNPAGASSNRRMNMMWNPMRQKLYIVWDGRSEIFAYDPYLDTFTVPTGAAAGMANSYQLIYNNWTGKSFAYKRGGQNQLNSTISAWEADPNEKHFLRARATLGAGSKQFATVLTPIIRGAGRSTSSPTPNTGIEAYIYNFSSNQWVLLGTNTNSNLSIADFQNSEIRQTFNNATAREYISNDGYVELMMVPRGNPAAGGTHEMFIESIAVEGRF